MKRHPEATQRAFCYDYRIDDNSEICKTFQETRLVGTYICFMMWRVTWFYNENAYGLLVRKRAKLRLCLI